MDISGYLCTDISMKQKDKSSLLCKQLVQIMIEFLYLRVGHLAAIEVEVHNGQRTLPAIHGVPSGHTEPVGVAGLDEVKDRKSTRLNSSHANISYAVFCLKKKIRSS